MERDMDLFRKLLMEVEALPVTVNWFPLTVKGYSQDAAWYHAQLAHDKGFIHARFLPGTFEFAVQRLTADGHEFLEMARDDTRWNHAKEKVKSATGSLTVEGLKTVLSGMIQAALKTAMGA
jgi:hypothetical protein